MNIKFTKVKIKNFLSIGDFELKLNDQGYILVKGINNCPKDNALSNGAGKSTWTSAICWALTGQLINGVSSNVKNINVSEKECYVTLEFTVDGNSYIITRQKEPKLAFKITLNETDVSGKTLTESEKIFNNLLPDLTSKLIASVIILGQGLPYKFSDNTPSGRKDVLEKLSKSDFMINDLKQRITNRTIVLNQSKRKLEDAYLIMNSEKTVHENNLTSLKISFEELSKPHNFDNELQIIEEKLQRLNKEREELKIKSDFELNCINEKSEKIQNILKEKTDKLLEDNNDFSDLKTSYLNKKYSLENEIHNLSSEIETLDAITDICPTCHQKIEGVVKPDTTKQKAKLAELKKELDLLANKYKQNESLHNDFLKSLTKEYQEKTEVLQEELTTNKTNKNQYDSLLRQKEFELGNLNTSVVTIKLNKENHLKELKETKDKIETLEGKLLKLNENIKTNISEKDNVVNHLDALSRMETLVSRDFRGFLLSTIIDYIDKKAKEYSKDIFNNDELDLKLEGNNINISYCGKPFECLSGGEKQKVDIIIQFAIRNMMVQYLNFSSNILVLDEITDNLDSVGCTNILNLISNKLNDIESIFIISHHTEELDIAADAQITIVKNRNGVSFLR